MDRAGVHRPLPARFEVIKGNTMGLRLLAVSAIDFSQRKAVPLRREADCVRASFF
jgi:hypothetical protein